MAASRSMLEALLARVQRRSQEPRAQAIHIPPLPVPQVAALEATHDAADTVPPQATVPRDVPVRTQPPTAYVSEVVGEEEDIEEYDDELIEIIDDADVIPQAAAAARAIEPGFGATFERRGVVANGKSAAPAAAVAAPAVAAPAVAAQAVVPRAASAPIAAEPLRPESVSARPVPPSQAVHTRGVRRELRATPFLELLEASLKLGG